MIKKASNSIASWLKNNHAIDDDETEIYAYAAFNLLHTAIPVFITFFIGSVMHMLVESVCLILPFILLRKYTGGYHAATPLRCILLSNLLLAFFLIAVRLTHYTSFCLFILLFLSEIILFVFSPVDPHKRKLEPYEKQLCYIRSKQMLALLNTVLTLLAMLHQSGIFVSIAYGIILCALLQLPIIRIDLRRRLL